VAENDRANGDAAEEAEDGQVDFEGLLLRAGFNYHVFLAAMFGYLREHGMTAGDFLAWTAARLASTWQGLEGHGADAVLRVVLDNLAATGYPVLSVEYGETESTAEAGATPLGLDREQWRSLLAPFAVEPAQMRLLFEVFAPLAAAAGASFVAEEDGETMKLAVRREPPKRTGQPVRFFE
jgi:hypothetical protein